METRRKGSRLASSYHVLQVGKLVASCCGCCATGGEQETSLILKRVVYAVSAKKSFAKKTSTLKWQGTIKSPLEKGKEDEKGEMDGSECVNEGGDQGGEE